ncbi:MAG TPA: ricin-type beta-trefoil lectin domain protein [Acidimicrobiia bacterium]|jgi:hypothetical protein|nr:ricin-type beta-trefoil lectin domain protein [Acidimicrobiia bacterium]
MRRIAVGVGIVLVVAGVGAGGAAVSARVAKVPQPHGIDFQIHTTADSNFCVDSPGDGSVIVASCVPNDNEHFTFTHNADGTFQLVDGFGNCLDRGDGKAGTLITTAACDFGPSQQFLYRLTDKINDPAGKVCVTAVKATQNASVYDDGCHRTRGDETFSLSR